MKFRLLFALLFPLQGFAQYDCSPEEALPFKPGERISYELVYNWGLIWAKAGKVDFQVNDTLIKGKKHYHFYSYGTSYRSWDWFYKVRSSYQSWTDESLRPIRFIREGREGSNYYHNDYRIEGNTASLRRMDSEGKIQTSQIRLPDCAFDVISAIYFCRTIPFSNLQPNEVIPLELYLDGAHHRSQLRYIGRQAWTDPRSKKAYQCHVFKPLLIQGTVFSEGENMTVWVSADSKRIPVYIETELVVGKAKVFLLEE